MQCCTDNGTTEGNKCAQTVDFFSVDSGSEPDSGISVSVSILVNETEIENYILLKKSCLRFTHMIG